MNKVTDDILYIGVNDYTIDLFESHYPVPKGITYNSYLIMDEKIMVIATTSEAYIDEWMANVKEALKGRRPDYLLIQHMEPDHSAAVETFMTAYPEAVIVASKPAFNMMNNYYGTDYAGRNLVIKEGDVLNLGQHELLFVAAPMVHWPEVMIAYDKQDHVLFSADAFGRFGAPADPAMSAVSPEFEDEDWLSEGRRYYIGIVGKQGDNVKKLFAKLAAADGMDTKIICALHGPVLTHDLQMYFDATMKWASYIPEEKGAAICYSSVYGHTKAAAELLAATLKQLYQEPANEVKNASAAEHRPAAENAVTAENADEFPVELYDLARTDVSAAVASAFRYDRVVLATTTYYNEIFPCMKDFINSLKDSAFRNRKIGLIENGSWAPKAASVMKGMLEDCPDLTFCEQTVSIKSAMNEDNRAQIAALAKELLA